MFENNSHIHVYSHGADNPLESLNQWTNGPVNAHLISRASVSTKTSLTKFNMVLKWVKVNSGSSFIDL